MRIKYQAAGGACNALDEVRRQNTGCKSTAVSVVDIM
jgi:hypothetical protein